MTDDGANLQAGDEFMSDSANFGHQKAQMPNIHLTDATSEHIDAQIRSGAYANVSEGVRDGMRLLMEKEGARAFHALKGELEAAAREAEADDFAPFDPREFEPDAFRE